MAKWVKIILSGSDAELGNIFVQGSVTASAVSASLSGDGSGITNINAPYAVVSGSLVGNDLILYNYSGSIQDTVDMSGLRTGSYTGSFIGEHRSSPGNITKPAYQINTGSHGFLDTANKVSFIVETSESIRIRKDNKYIGIGTDPTNSFDIAGDARIRTVNNLLSSTTKIGVFDSNNVLQYRSPSQLREDIGAAAEVDAVLLSGSQTVDGVKTFVNGYKVGNHTILTVDMTVDPGLDIVASIPQTGNDGLVFEYCILNGSNRRVGHFWVVHDGSTIEDSDISTLSIGATGTDDVSLSAILSGGNIIIQSSVPLAHIGWRIKGIIRTL